MELERRYLTSYPQPLQEEAMYFSTLTEWLTWIESIHFSTIDLGLDRIGEVARKLELLPLGMPVITVAGTNGKGSTVAALEGIYKNSGYKVGCYTSPILYRHHEQVRINSSLPSDEDFCRAYETIESKRGNISLTPFEYHTLAALLLFQKQPLDILVLEVGMGGRLDAVNIVDADIAIVTSIDIDHAQWLGDSREKIALEKAGIFREHHPAVCGDFNAPQSLIDYAKRINAPLYLQGVDFNFSIHEDHWQWHFKSVHYDALPMAGLALQNLSTALMAVTLLQKKRPVSYEAIKQAFKNINLPGRIQIIDKPVQQIFDVAHNPAAVAHLAATIKKMPKPNKTTAVFSMLSDKDIQGSVKQIIDLVDEWYIAPLQTARSSDRSKLSSSLYAAGAKVVLEYNDIEEAYKTALEKAHVDDRLIIFGSFHTVSEALSLIKNIA